MALIVGEALSYLQINRLSLIFSFQSGGQISTEARITHLNSEGQGISTYLAGTTPTNFTVISLLERVVTDVLISSGILEVEFDNGERLRFDSGGTGQEIAFINFPNGHQLID